MVRRRPLSVLVKTVEGAADFERETLTELHGLAVDAALDVLAHAGVRVLAEHLRHGAADHLLVRNAEPRIVGAVAEAIALVAVDVRDQRRDVVRHQAQALFALAQRGFGGGLHLHGAPRDQHRRGEQQSRAGHEGMQDQFFRQLAVSFEPRAQPIGDLGPGGEDEEHRADDDQKRRQEGRTRHRQ